MAKPKYYVTAPIYDAATSPQIGSRYTAILCDAIALHKHMCGFEVAHFARADTHGVNIESSENPSGNQQLVSVWRNYSKFEQLSKLADVGHTCFSRISSAEHILTVPCISSHAFTLWYDLADMITVMERWLEHQI